MMRTRPSTRLSCHGSVFHPDEKKLGHICNSRKRRDILLFRNAPFAFILRFDVEFFNAIPFLFQQQLDDYNNVLQEVGLHNIITK